MGRITRDSSLLANSRNTGVVPNNQRMPGSLATAALPTASTDHRRLQKMTTSETLSQRDRSKTATDLKMLVDAVKRAETLLESKFGASGRGLYEKLDSVRANVPAKLHGTIRYMATVRNKAMHEDGYEIDDFGAYMEKANWVNVELEKGPQPSPTSPESTVPGCGSAAPVGTSRLRRDAGFFIFGAVAAIGIQQLSSNNSTANPIVPGTMSVGPALTSRVVTAPTSAQPDAPVRNDPKSVAAMIAQGKSAGLGNGALRINRVTMSYEPDVWGHEAPKIVADVTNVSDRTISSADVEARLYINNAHSPTTESKSSYLFFGDRGLPAGASAKVDVTLETFTERNWTVPDALNAQRRMAAIRVHRTTDGSNRDFGGAAPQLTDP